jgi:DNA-binding response OmpR family regulator
VCTLRAPLPRTVTEQARIAREPLATVLVCEDEDALRELIRIALDGFEVIEAADGDTALERARRERPAVVLVDLMLPRTSGLDVIRTLKGDPATAGILVVVLSAWRESADEALAAGADSFVAKPFDPGDLRTLIEGMLTPP